MAKLLIASVVLSVVPALAFALGNNELRCDDLESDPVAYDDLESAISELVDQQKLVLLCMSRPIENPRPVSLDSVRQTVEVRLEAVTGSSGVSQIDGGFVRVYQESKAPFGKWRPTPGALVRAEHIVPIDTTIKSIAEAVSFEILKAEPNTGVTYRVGERQ